MRRDVSRQHWLGSNEVSEAAAAVCFILAGNEVPSRGRLAASTRNRVCSLSGLGSNRHPGTYSRASREIKSWCAPFHSIIAKLLAAAAVCDTVNGG